MKGRAPSLQTLSLAIFLGLVAGAIAYVGLAAYGQPENFSNRVANLQDRVDQIERLSRVPASARNYQPGALCPSATPEPLNALASELQNRASGLGLTIVSLAVTPPGHRQGSVDRVGLQFEVSGPYSAATAFLSALSVQTPRIFVDRLDLTDRTAKVSLRFTGHFYCSTAT